MAMLTKRRSGFILALIFAVAPAVRAADEVAVVRKTTRLLEEISSNPKSGIPARFLQEARGIVIIPGVVNKQLGVGRKEGHGVFLSRDDKGEWGSVRPVEISGSSAGVVAGRDVTDLVIIYRTREAAERYGEDAESRIAFVQISTWRRRKFSGPRFDSNPTEDVLTYTRSRGIIVGAAMGGEHRWGPSWTPEESKTPPATVLQVAEREANSPEVGRLKAVLTAMTTSATAPVAEAGMKDPKVSPAGGARPSAAMPAPPR
jgi:lipid-binding SYLF domain-containing protein